MRLSEAGRHARLIPIGLRSAALQVCWVWLVAACVGSGTGPLPEDVIQVTYVPAGTAVDGDGVLLEAFGQMVRVAPGQSGILEDVPPTTSGVATVSDVGRYCAPLGGTHLEGGSFQLPIDLDPADRAIGIEIACFGDLIYASGNDVVYVTDQREEIRIQADFSSFIDWSPTGNLVVFSPYRATDFQHQPSDFMLAYLPGAPSTHRVTRLSGIFGSPTISPDGNQLAYARRFADTDGIWTSNLDGTNATLLTSPDPNVDRRPSWSPDGSRIAFSRQLPGSLLKSGVGLFIMDADGANQNRILDTPEIEHGPLWSPSGDYLLYVLTTITPEGGGFDEYWIVRSDGSGNRRLSDGEWIDCRWTPDVDELICLPEGLTVVSSLRLDTAGNVVTEIPVWQPTWTAGDRWIFGQSPEPNIQEGLSAVRERDGAHVFLPLGTLSPFLWTPSVNPARIAR